MSKLFSILLVGLCFLSACQPTPPGTPPPGTFAPAPDWLTIYFTDPSAPASADYIGGPDEALAAAIDGARLSVDVAAYSLNLWSIRNALLRAYHRGVVVRVVMESDNLEEDEPQALIAAGIPVLGDRREGLMHDKFVVIDRSEVWTGSMNYTLGGAYYDDNNLICIRSSRAAENYTREFEEMFLGDHFGPDAVADTPSPRLTIDDARAEFYFSPDDGAAARIVELIQGAQESIHFMAFSFTANNIGAAVRERAQAGITVAGVMDESQTASNQGTEFDPFMQAGLDVRLDGNEGGLMHHKVIIVDWQIVITGSYNFTASAEENNDENVIIIFSPQVAATFLEEFQRVYAQAQP